MICNTAFCLSLWKFQKNQLPNMNEPIKYIAKVEIKNLWGRYDIEWNLDPSVNVLSGINGSGKSTVLRCLITMMGFNIIDIDRDEKIESILVKFNNGKEIKSSVIIDDLSTTNTVRFEGIKSIEFDAISTFDNKLNENASPDKKVKTELDKNIFFLNQKYLAYQNNILNKTVKALSNSNNSDLEEIKNITRKRERLLDIIDTLFEETGKKVDRNIEGNSTDIAFINGKDILTPYQLSSGEKQMLVILLTVLVQDNKPSILFMDEPEISLHLDWQRKLIQYIKELNPNVQIILATHSPGIILEGWRDKVTEMTEIITLDRKAKS
jgi:ABC-type cobalamin/Fe3+-siderophores transport system ATPase subunit